MPIQTTITKTFNDFISQDETTLKMLKNAKKFSRLNAPLLIEGETGTGKDLLSEACVKGSLRKAQKFIAINCAGLPKEQAESEMFGQIDHESGKATLGFFEYANGGTVLLDGVAELPLSLQAKLLRFLTDGTFRRVGEDKSQYADVRVICTSQLRLKEAVALGKMREDLFHRLNVLTLYIPPLRERLNDISLLSEHFVRLIGQSLGKNFAPLSEDFLQFLSQQPWYGNGRELYNVLYRACTLTEENQLSLEYLDLPQEKPSVDFVNDNQTLDEIMHAFEEKVLRHFYQQYPTTRKLAERLGISHTAVANKLKFYGIKKGE